jgi:exopolysaccharide production protein ExoQ
VGGSHASRQAAYLAIGMLGLVLLFKRTTDFESACDQTLLGLLASLMVFVVLSAAWADEMFLSLKRSLIPILICLGGLGMSRQMRPREICLFALMMSAIFLISGVAMECMSGTFLRGSEYRFSGTLHPNRQAVNCTIFCLSALCLGAHSVSWKRLWLAAFLVGLAMLALTRSRAGLISFGAGALLLWSMNLSGARRILLFATLGLLGGLAVLLALASQGSPFELFVDAVRLGREQEAEDVTSLTGRIPIWTALIGDIAHRPVLGHGYGGFWTEERVVQFSYVRNWEFDHAHSIYLEAVLNIGVVGLCLGAVLLFVALRRASAAYRRTHDVGFQFAFVLLATAAIHGFLDTIYVRPDLGMLLGLACVGMLVFHGRPAPQRGEV